MRDEEFRVRLANRLEELRAELGMTNALLREVSQALRYRAELEWLGLDADADTEAGTRPPWPPVMPCLRDGEE